MTLNALLNYYLLVIGTSIVVFSIDDIIDLLLSFTKDYDLLLFNNIVDGIYLCYFLSPTPFTYLLLLLLLMLLLLTLILLLLILLLFCNCICVILLSIYSGMLSYGGSDTCVYLLFVAENYKLVVNLFLRENVLLLLLIFFYIITYPYGYVWISLY